MTTLNEMKEKINNNIKELQDKLDLMEKQIVVNVSWNPNTERGGFNQHEQVLVKFDKGNGKGIEAIFQNALSKILETPYVSANPYDEHIFSLVRYYNVILTVDYDEATEEIDLRKLTLQNAQDKVNRWVENKINKK